MGALDNLLQDTLSLVTRDIQVESAWLTALARLEDLASVQILSNLSGHTPFHERRAIEAHAADEMRHRNALLMMRPVAQVPAGRYLRLEKKLSELAESFIIGYFSNPLLTTAPNRHAAYVHGALTIEQFPFQIYAAYWKATKIPAVRDQLLNIMKEEHGHLALGNRLRANLPEKERLPVETLQQIEIEMCAKMIRRMRVALREFYGIEKEKQNEPLVNAVTRDSLTLTAWVFALGHAEKSAAQTMRAALLNSGVALTPAIEEHVNDEIRHGQMLQRSVLLDRRRNSRDPAYFALESGLIAHMDTYLNTIFGYAKKRGTNPMSTYRIGARALESRVFRHYMELEKSTDHLLVAQTLSMVLQDEIRHAQIVQSTSSEPEEIDFEHAAYERLSRKIIRQTSIEKVAS
ncbi:MAG: ferritin-like domain-containing protein [Oligoflexia bacterium]|nr:ferritin-like domain-containing protein [Oligoflexia bacterium]